MYFHILPSTGALRMTIHPFHPLPRNVLIFPFPFLQTMEELIDWLGARHPNLPCACWVWMPLPGILMVCKIFCNFSLGPLFCLLGQYCKGISYAHFMGQLLSKAFLNHYLLTSVPIPNPQHILSRHSSHCILPHFISKDILKYNTIFKFLYKMRNLIPSSHPFSTMPQS